MADDKSLKQRGDFDYRYSNTNIGVFKWKDNRVVTLATNFHGAEESSVKRTQKDGSKAEIRCPSVATDYNRHMGGVDHADQLKTTYGMNRRSKKWWHRLFWGFLEMAFINAFIIHSQLGEKMSTLEFRRSVSQGLMNFALPKTRKRSSILKPIQKRRKYNYSVLDDIRLGNRGAHWVHFGPNRGRCEFCSSQGIQSKPHSKCSACGVFLCCNDKKKLFSSLP